jgi:EAL and modified HD-GYP domain-containing signal transduction protein
MSDVFVARQPIFDRRLHVAGYELLFRADSAADRALVSDPQAATATVLLNSFTDIGLERIVGAAPAWLNVSREFLLDGLAQLVPPAGVVLELLENQEVDEALMARVVELGRQGYRLALDDFACEPQADQLVSHVDVVKLDLMALGRDRFAATVHGLESRGVTILAEKLETYEDYRFCRTLGCDLFQGYFFCRPELVQQQGAQANGLALLELLAELQDPGVDLPALERTIATDVSLSNRLLRYINSAFFGLRQQVRSINQAVALLGIDNLKRWGSLSAFASVTDKPAELTVTALIRARFCELAGERESRLTTGSELFTLGLFSVIDALLDRPIDELLAQLPFPQDMCDALSSHEGENGRLLECLVAVEAGHFDAARTLVSGAGELYLESLEWATGAAHLL